MKKLIIALFVVINFNFSSFALNPVKDYPFKPDEYGMNYEEVTIKTDDNVNLNGWYFKASETSYKVIILCGNGDGNMSDLIEIASSFLSLGYHVLTFDYRGYGKSDDFNINKKFYIYSQFEKDVNAAIDFMKTKYPNIPQIHLYGRGIGAGLAVAVGANRNITTIIADSPYTTFEEIQKTLKTKKSVDVLIPLGYNKVLMEPKYALEEKGSSIKKLILVAGDQDDIYTSESIRELAKIKDKITSVCIIKGTNSSNTFSNNKDKYFTEIKKNLQE